MPTDELIHTEDGIERRTALLGQVWLDIRDVVIEQVDVIDTAALALLTPGAPFEQTAATRMAHRLAGSLGSFGVPEVSEDARELEVLFEGLATEKPSTETMRRIVDLAVGLREHIALVDSSFSAAADSIDLTADETYPGLAVVPAPDDHADPQVVDVVVVEDDPVTAEIVVQALRHHGLSTRAFADGAEALAALSGPLPRLQARVILLDVDLPSLSGLDVLRNLQRTGVLGRSKVIVLTARSSEAETIQAFDLGAVDHVAKPFSQVVLVRRVKLALER